MLVDQIPEKQKSRYHINEDALITLPSGEIVAISNQWGIVNIELLIEFVRQNGFVVEKLNSKFWYCYKCLHLKMGRTFVTALISQCKRWQYYGARYYQPHP